MKKIIFLLLLSAPLSVYSQLVINELMTNNVSAILDDDYNYSMWVEIYNKSTTTSYNQSAYYFTDKLSEPKKWAPLSKMIAPGGFGVLYFERPERAAHASFKLDPEGGKLYLQNASGQTIDSVKYPPQYRNISYGRKTDGASEWTFYEQFSAGSSNNVKVSATERCGKPVFVNPGGFFTSTINVKFANPAAGDTIYYTKNGAEPTKTNSVKYTPGFVITITSTTIIRAKCFSAKKLSSDIATNTYFIGERDFNLPVVSIVTEQANLTDNTIGIYCDGTNGITGNGQSSPRNYNQDWDRPVNYELFDTTGVVRLNQEVDIKILGGWTRANTQKSIAIMPRKKHGDNQLRYDVFAATKPFNKYKDIQMRNSGNDFSYSMMRDGFMQSIVMKRLDIDYLAYEPSVCFMNGVYFGIQNLRERSNTDYLFSNYGLEEDEVTIMETNNIDSEKVIATNSDFVAFSNFLKSNDITNSSVYQQITNKMDVDEFINYNIAEIFFGNYDWPYNNVKIWKKNTENKWRWILFDTDFGYGLYNNTLYNFNTLTFALGENQQNIIGGYTVQPEWSVIVLSKLVQNPTFLNKFIDRFAIHLSSTFETNRLNAVLDSVSAKISNEIVYHKAKFGSARTFANDIATMKTFSANRPGNMLSYISSRFLNSTSINTVQLSSNIPNASYKLNSEIIQDAAINLKYFTNRTMALEANTVPAYKFKHWELSTASGTTTLIPMGSTWKYSDGSSIPATNWFTSTYTDTSWKSGTAQFGYGNRGELTTISYGSNASNKYPTAYFRKTISISNLSAKSNFILTTFIDDGAAVYVNGTELGRVNMPTGSLMFTTLASSSNNGITNTFSIPINLLKEGNNVIAVEVHQNSVTSSDLIFNLSLTCSETSNTQLITNPVYTTALTSDFTIKAIYEQSIFEDPDKDINVVFNEIVASNNQTTDEFGEKDDYIEIYNNGDKEVNIAGWFISDTPGNTAMVQIPVSDAAKTLIPSKGRIILWADDQPEQGVLHLGFKLSKDGETLVLSKSNYLGAIMLMDSISYPYMEQNFSYSRVPDGSENWKIQSPTFNLTNGDNTDVKAPEIRLNIYPTLVQDNITVVNATNKTFNIIDLTGKVLYNQICQSDKEIIQTNQLPRGIYIVVIGDEKFKIIKM